MPKITIREKDLTSAGNLEATTNAVYIPGYANMGPVNKPTLCETVNDFKLTFGSIPYRFRTDQSWKFDTDGCWESNSYNVYMGNFCQAGDYEKSYIMAVSLLKAGIPIIYERVFNRGIYNSGTDTFHNDNLWTAREQFQVKSSEEKYNIVSTSPGLSGNSIYVSVKERSYDLTPNVTATADKVYGYYYVFSIRRQEDQDLGISQVAPVDTIITFNSKVASQFDDAIYISSGQRCIDNSGLVEFQFGAVSASTQLAESTEVDGKVQETKLNITKQNGINYDQAANFWKDEFTVQDMYRYLCTISTDPQTGESLGLERLLDNGEYAIKFITSGAYPTLELKKVGNYEYNNISKRMIEIAAERGNSTALIDHTPNNQRSLVATNTNSVYYAVAGENGFGKTTRVNSLGEDANTFAAMFTPYGIYETDIGDVMLPASYGYLAAYAAQVQSTNSWLATAGCDRGYVPGLKALCQNVTNAVADSYQPRNGIAINAITNIKPYGLMIWGARTLKDNIKKGNLTATSFLNIRQLTNDVKRQVWVASKYLTFEQNSDILWIKFKNKITPLLDNMVNGGGISTYEIKRQSTTQKATVKAVVRLYSIEPIEDWDITIELADSTTEILG